MITKYSEAKIFWGRGILIKVSIAPPYLFGSFHFVRSLYFPSQQQQQQQQHFIHISITGFVKLIE